MLVKSDVYRSFVAKPYAVVDDNGEVLDMSAVMLDLTDDVQLVTDLASWELTEENLLNVDSYSISQNTTIGRRMGIRVPDEYKITRKSGNSRFDKLLQDRVVRELKSWGERRNALQGTSTKRMSAGWKRTVNGNKPSHLHPKFSLSATDKGYSKLSVEGSTLTLRMVVGGEWRTFLFDFDRERFDGFIKVTLPDIYLRKGKPVFSFAVAYDYIYSELSESYVVGVDVGVNNYATVSVVDTVAGKIVHTTTLSRRVHSLWNKVRSAQKQVSALTKTGRKFDAHLHRASNSRRKKQLAIEASQEIAHIAHVYGNALVAMEDLSWVTNTMQYGRWNRGELTQWLEHFLNLNGSRLMRVSAYNTSKECHLCETMLEFPNYSQPYCPNCQIVHDRDVNASANIALRLVHNGTHSKCVTTRRKAKRYTRTQVKRSRAGTGSPLKHPGRDRTKTRPTPKRKKGVKRVLVRCSAPARKDVRRVVLDVSGSNNTCVTDFSSTKNTDNKTIIYRV